MEITSTTYKYNNPDALVTYGFTIFTSSPQNNTFYTNIKMKVVDNKPAILLGNQKYNETNVALFVTNLRGNNSCEMIFYTLKESNIATSITYNKLNENLTFTTVVLTTPICTVHESIMKINAEEREQFAQMITNMISFIREKFAFAFDT